MQGNSQSKQLRQRLDKLSQPDADDADFWKAWEADQKNVLVDVYGGDATQQALADADKRRFNEGKPVLGKTIT